MTTFDGVHGVVQDSAKVTLDDLANVSTSRQGVIRVDGSVSSNTPPLTEGRDWTIYEAVDWLMQGYDAPTDWSLRRTLALNVGDEHLTFGRGRVAYQPALPPWETQGRTPIGVGTSPWCRARARTFRATTIDLSAQFGIEVVGAGDDLIIRNNYRAWVCEGRTRTQHVSGTGNTLREDLVVTDDEYTITLPFIPFTVGLPDFCVACLVCPPSAQATTIGFLDQFGSPIINFGSATVITVPTRVPVPNSACRMILTTADARSNVPLAFECEF